MPYVLTAGSMLYCAHQGTVQLTAGQSSLLVDGQAVLVQGDLEGSPISGCMTPSSQTSKPCTTLLSMTVGSALHFKAGGMLVLLDTAAGNTDGVTPAPSNLWSVRAAGQSKLTAS